MDEITNTELLIERLIALEDSYGVQSQSLADLTEYLTRVDPNFIASGGHPFGNWRSRLEDLRNEERIEKEIFKAKQTLKGHGYIVVANENELDAARVAHWVSSNPAIGDDDIPF